MPSTIQTALLVESLLNLPAIIALLFFPSQTLTPVLASPLPSLELNGTAILLARSFGAIILALTPQLLLAYPNTKDCVAKRKIVYITLGVGEAVLVPLLLWEAFRASDADKAKGVWTGGLGRRACLVAVASLMPLLGWRGFCFLGRPELFEGKGDVTGNGKKRE